MSAIAEKGGGTFQGIKLLLCENPLPPIDEAIAAAQAEVPHISRGSPLFLRIIPLIDLSPVKSLRIRCDEYPVPAGLQREEELISK
jgi:hypothetical protein